MSAVLRLPELCDVVPLPTPKSRILALDVQRGPIVGWADSDDRSGVLCWSGRADLREARLEFQDWLTSYLLEERPARLLLVLRRLRGHDVPSEAARAMRETAIGLGQVAGVRLQAAHTAFVEHAVIGRAKAIKETTAAVSGRLRRVLEERTGCQVQAMAAHAVGLALLEDSFKCS